MKNLILLANEFPYGNWEPYLETEVNYYDKFDNVLICSLQTRKEHMNTFRKIKSDKIRFSLVKYAPKAIYFLNSIKNIFDVNFYKETFKLIKNRKFTLKRFINLCVFISRSHYEANKIIAYLKNSNLFNLYKNSETIIYSYRFEYQPYVAFLMKKKLKNCNIISRAHGFDLYEERRNTKYIPLREFLINSVDYVLPISNHGKNYINNSYNVLKNNIKVFRLGVYESKKKAIKKSKYSIDIVTCSTVTKIKRLDLLIESLATIKDYQIKWTHYGNGEDFDKIKKIASIKLKNNITYEFKGHIDNKKIATEYDNNNYNLFINVSEYEGIPVSIMEALAFGIPCIATNVGGNTEIIIEGYNGKVIEKEFKIEDLAEKIKEFINMDYEQYKKFSDNSYKSWEREYNADINYKEFINFLMNLK